ncbi:uncharacterized protein [Cicer arietinum]|uniref:Uncharacterized protein LOC101495179 n=1 Tax=Cicer arietinum TaxID=3827 RepID=A0A1S2XKQ6_CICAR|nr:uncharacterized protein LOC101495179 [Cicer arietinum]
MKKGAFGLMKKVMCDLRSKTKSMKAQLVIMSLVMNKRYMMCSISHKFKSFLRHHSHPKEKKSVFGHDNEHNKPINVMLINDNNAHSNEASEIQVVVEDKEYESDYENCYHSMYDDDDDDDDDGGKCMDFESIDLVKSWKEELKVEDEIDHLAELFIKKFRSQILLQNQDSL